MRTRIIILLGVLCAGLLASSASATSLSDRQQIRSAARHGAAAVTRLIERRLHRAHGAASDADSQALVNFVNAVLVISESDSNVAIAVLDAPGLVVDQTDQGVDAEPDLQVPFGGVVYGPMRTAHSSAMAHSAGCHGYVWVRHYWSVPIVHATVGDVVKTVGGWCGNGGSITWVTGWAHKTYHWGPYCLTVEANLHGWDSWPGWQHGGIWAHMGVWTPWGSCVHLSHGGHATIRIAANLYWDAFNDYGFSRDTLSPARRPALGAVPHRRRAHRPARTRARARVRPGGQHVRHDVNRALDADGNQAAQAPRTYPDGNAPAR